MTYRSFLSCMYTAPPPPWPKTDTNTSCQVHWPQSSCNSSVGFLISFCKVGEAGRVSKMREVITHQVTVSLRSPQVSFPCQTGWGPIPGPTCQNHWIDLLAVLGVVPVDSVLLPVAHVYLLHAAQHQLQRERECVNDPAPAPSPPAHSTSSAHWQMKSSQTFSTISAGSFNNMDNIGIERRPPQNKGPGRGGCEDPNQNNLPCNLGPGGVWGFTGEFLWVHREAIKQ